MTVKAATLETCQQLEDITGFIVEQSQLNPDFANSIAVDYLHAVGLLSFVYMYARISKAASTKDDSYFQNKLVLANYYVAKILPDLSARIQRIQAGAELVMQLPEDYFTAQA